MVAIMESRVGHTVVSKDALNLIALKVASRNGDIRGAFDMLSLAIRKKLASHGSSPEQQQQQNPGCLINPRFISSCLQQKGIPSLQRIETLPSAGRLVLCVLISLSKSSKNFRTISEVFRHVKECLKSSVAYKNSLDIDGFKQTLTTLNDTDLFTITQNKTDGVQFLLPASDIEEKLERFLGKRCHEIQEISRSLLSSDM